MKKSKVLVPAMALLLFSTAASITGTVAWFTSVRTFETSAGEFTVKEVDGNLNVTLAAGQGTTAVKNNGTAPGEGEKAEKIAVAANSFLIDGSVDHATGKAYRLSRNPSDTERYHDYGTASSTWLYRTDASSNKYYIAMSWTMTFSYTFGTETNAVGIYLNLKDSVFNNERHSGGIENGTNDTAKGFRIAFVSDSGFNKVWGNNTVGTLNTSANTDLTYVNSQTGLGKYTSSNYMKHDSNYVTIADGTADAENLVERIGTLTTSDADTVVTCIAWFEGTDPNVVTSDQTDLKTLSAAMSFYARLDD